VAATIAARPEAASLRPPYVVGGLTVAQVHRVASFGAARFPQCTERPRSLTLPGAWTFGVSFTIGGDGRVASIEQVGLSTSLPDISACIGRAVRTWVFPRPAEGGTVRVDYIVDLFF
jgi:hypothetical protein